MTPTSIRLGPGTKARVKRLADATERSESRLIRYALELGLRQLEAQQPSPCGKEDPTMPTVYAADGRFTSPDTHHVAVRINSTSWKVTFLRPDHRLTRNQAMTAMHIAATVGGADEITPGGPEWRLIGAWAAELGLDAEGAIGYASRPHRWQQEV